jgi:hypothetical protein
MRSLITILLLVLVFAVTHAFGADATGTWKGDVKLPTGQILPFTAHLKQQHGKITGTLDGINGGGDVVVMDGKITADVLTFWGVRKINGVDVRFNYTGKVLADGIDFQIMRADGTGMPLEALTKRAP